MVEFTTPPGDQFDGRLMLQVGQHDDDGTVYTIDDVAIEEVADVPTDGAGNVAGLEPVVIENDGSLFPGDVVAKRGAHQLQMALKNKSGGGVDPHAGHNH